MMNSISGYVDFDKIKYFFKTLSNTRDSNTTDITPDGLASLVKVSDSGTFELAPLRSKGYTSFSHVYVYGTGVMTVKGYEREIFVAASGGGVDSMCLDFFALNADDEGNLSQEALKGLRHETPFNGNVKIVSIATGDFDGDKYDNEVALMINTRNDIWLFVYKLNYSNGQLEVKSLGDEKGIHVYSTDQWGNDLESQPVTDMVAGDFDGDGTSEIALLFKISKRASGLANPKGWTSGPKTGDIHCKIHKWNANSRKFDTAETAVAYNKEELVDSSTNMVPSAKVAGVVGLRATTADLDGDGKDEIVTLLLGYYHGKQWDSKLNPVAIRHDSFYAFPHLAVWKFNRDSIKPIHDDAHIMGGGTVKTKNGDNLYGFSWLNEHSANTKGLLLSDTEPFLKYERTWQQMLFPFPTDPTESVTGTNPDSIEYMYAPRMFSIAAGPFTGTLGQLRTVDDIAVAWRDKDGNDCVTVFKTKLNASKQFDGFEDGKLALQDKRSGQSWRGLVAADLVAEGVELDKPTHLMKRTQRSYIAALNAVPYHVDTVNADGTALTEQPTNFTYSEPMTGGNMTVSYGKSTTDSKTDTVKQDLSQSVETVFAADPTGTDQKVQGILGKVKGLTAFASAIGDIAHGISLGNMTTEQKREAVWKPDSPTAGLTDMIEFFTDKVENVDQRSNTESSTTTIDKNITATTHDAILYTDTARHIWRYPVMTRPLPMWLAWGPRIDSTQIDNPGEVQGDKELFLTFTMSENSALQTSTSIHDSKYEPLHEEGNFFSYPSQIGDVEGYNDAGLLAEEDKWDFSNNPATTGITFTKASSNMQHTEKKVTPSGFTSTVGFFDMLFNGDKATGLKMPDSQNPKTFSKEYSKNERISYSLQGSSNLTSMMAADHTVKMQPFVAKEGAMTLGTAVELSYNNSPYLWSTNSIYRQKADPALLLPLKFVKNGATFIANTNQKSAMKIRGIRYYSPDFAFFTDNRLINGMKYEIRVPLYNASFKDTGNFNVRLSWAADNSPTATKTPISTVTMSLGGWDNNRNSNKGTAVFEWTPNLTSNKKASNKEYYFYVEIDPDNALDEVHDGRYKSDNTTINDYGGNNTGFSMFYVYDADDSEASGGTVISSAADEEIQLNPLTFKDGDGKAITDIANYIIAHTDDSYVTITAEFTYNGPEVAYAYFVGYILTPSGKQKIPDAGINTIVDLGGLEYSDVSDMFMLNDIALFNGVNKLTFTFSPAELLAKTQDINSTVANSATFGILTLTEEEMQDLEDEEYYEGEDPSFELEPIPDNIVSESVGKTYTLNSDESVFWLVSSVKLSGTASTAASDEDYRDYLDITLKTENASDDTAAPDNYGQTATITVSSIAGYTPKGDYELTVQKSADGDEWTDAEVLKFNAANSEDDGNGENMLFSSSSGCNAGLGFGTLAFLLSRFIAFRRKNLQLH